jgi:formylglycine-generating enzyme required for sulfatase activity
MHGNVWEWCQDTYDRADGERSARKGPDISGAARSCRGGSWNQAAIASRSEFRFGHAPTDRSFDGGFRVVQVW